MSYQDVINRLIMNFPKSGKILLRHRCNGKPMTRKYFLNPDHTYRECGLMEWAKQFETMDRQVADDIINDCRISTVWLGNDHNYFNDGPPLLLETMIFDKGESLNYLDRYTTWDEALEGHQRAVQWVKNGCKEDQR